VSSAACAMLKPFAAVSMANTLEERVNKFSRLSRAESKEVLTVDSILLICKSPAASALGAVEPGDCLCPTDVGEGGERTESLVNFGNEPIIPARDTVETALRVVVRVVVGRRGGKAVYNAEYRDSSECGQESREMHGWG
jgi:hypothetical protein